MPVHEKEREGHKIRVFSFEDKQTSEVKIGDLDLGPNMDSIEECSPFTLLRQLRFDKFCDADMSSVTNRMQLTNDWHTHILQIYRDRKTGHIDCAMLAREIGEDQKLDDPNNFVEPGLHISRIDGNEEKSRKVDV